MPEERKDPETVAEQVRKALNSADLSAFRELLDPQVKWGPPDDQVSGCHNRDEVIAWYRRAQRRGMRGRVTEVVAGADSLLVGLRVAGTPQAVDGGGEADRWQVLKLRAGRIVDIRGFPDRAEAAARAGLPAGPPS